VRAPISKPRRRFLQVSALAGGGLLLSHVLAQSTKSQTDTAQQRGKGSFTPSPFVKIRPDGAVILVAKIPELGQGVKTALPMILADELGADFQTVQIESGTLDSRLGAQEAGGSMSVFDSYQPLREAGALARTLLIRAAASHWSVPAKECSAAGSKVSHPPTGRSLTFGELADRAAALPMPAASDIVLRQPREQRLIGQRIGGVDNQAIVTGKPLFGIDQTAPGMVHAVYVKCPTSGGRVTSANLDHIKRLPGIVDAFILVGTADPYGLLPGVAIVGNSTWSTFKAHDELRVTWESSAKLGQDSASYERRAAEIGGTQGSTVKSVGDVPAALRSASKSISATYHYPFLHHAPLEPMNALAIPLPDGGMKIVAPTQSPQDAQELAAKVLNLPKAKVELHFTRSGGAFGRRLVNDFVAEAAAIAQRVGRPVKLTWRRDSDTQHGKYRPAGWHFLQAGLDGAGKPVAWRNHFVTVGLNSTSKPGTAADIGGNEFPSRFLPNFRQEKSVISANVPTNWWRAPGANGFSFVFQSFVDELAHAAGKDPLEFRLAMLGEDRVFAGTGRWDPAFDTARMKAVLRLAAERAGWGKRLPAGSGQGIAFHFSHQGYVAEVAEVSVSPEGVLAVKRVTAAVDVGPIINRSGAESQVQGSIMDGLSAAWLQEITIADGAVQQSNFHDFPVLRMDAAPRQVDVHFIESKTAPTGLGEPALPPVAPAVCNAIFAAVGTRIRRLPISRTDLKWDPTKMKASTLQGADIGSPRLRGETRQTSTAVSMLAGGIDIWGARDEGHFAHLPVSGDFEISARVDSLEMADLYTKAGIMFRSSLDEGSPHVMLFAFGNNEPRNKNNGGLEFQFRKEAGGLCAAIYPPQPLPAAPDFPADFPKVWLKLVRRGDVFNGLFSRDGTNWKTYCTHSQNLPRSGFLGLAVTAHNEAQRVAASFSQLLLG
jgi:isoquinoline 1-oxidoreductase beta subunit